MAALRILYVDDDADIRTIVGMALSLDPDVRIDVASSGTEALAMIANGTKPDVAVLDVMMPEMDGPALLKRLQDGEKTHDIPVIFMTAKARRSDVTRYLDEGVIGVILKPFDPIQLAAEIRTLYAAHSAREAARH